MPMPKEIQLKAHWGDRLRDAYWDARRKNEWPRMKKLHLAMLCFTGLVWGVAFVVAISIA